MGQLHGLYYTSAIICRERVRVSYSRAKGLYAGISLDGAVVASRGALNQAYYGKEVSPIDILIRRTVTNPHAAGLIEAVNKAVSGK